MTGEGAFFCPYELPPRTQGPVVQDREKDACPLLSMVNQSVSFLWSAIQLIPKISNAALSKFNVFQKYR